MNSAYGDGINVFITNARSLCNKWDGFVSYICVEDFDIACITESWISEKHFGDIISSYTIKGYNTFLIQ